MDYELVVKEPFTAHDKEMKQREHFHRGAVITDETVIRLIEKGPWARHVMRRAIPPSAPQPEPAAQAEQPADIDTTSEE